MKTNLLTIFTRTPLHVGAGASVGAVDQPVVRERHTHFPIIPGSAIKGVLADLWLDASFKRNAEGKKYFGEDDNDAETKHAGALAFGEAKLLAFPVRSARGCFAFVTSPLCLERYKRDAGLDLEVPSVKPNTCLAGADVVFEDKNAVVLEEYCFANKGAFPEAWAKQLVSLADDAVLNGGAARFVLLADEDMSFFAENACQISQHVSIDSQSGTAAEGKLFNQEEVPSETLFYAPITQVRNDVDVQPFATKLASCPLVQFGGKGTSGIGYCSVKLG